VKRHHRPHAKNQPCPCPHGVFWSAPSEKFQLAPQFDLDGTSNRPVVVQLPDLDDLAARARPSLGVGLKKPKNSLMVAGNGDGKIESSGRTTAPETCFFALPLFVIVASFLFSLFLPVVVLLFNVFFLLRLKFCIPPSIDAKVHAELKAEVDAQLEIGATVEVDENSELGAKVVAELIQLLPDAADKAQPPTTESLEVKALRGTFTAGALAQMDVELGDASTKVHGGAGAVGPSLSGDIAWEAEVKWG
jgi:hypothetical protein